MKKATIKVQVNDIVILKDQDPFTTYCRKLIKDGAKPNTRLEMYRGDILCLFTNNIGKTAKITVREDERRGPEFTKYKEFPKQKFV